MGRQKKPRESEVSEHLVMSKYHRWIFNSKSVFHRSQTSPGNKLELASASGFCATFPSVMVNELTAITLTVCRKFTAELRLLMMKLVLINLTVTMARIATK